MAQQSASTAVALLYLESHLAELNTYISNMTEKQTEPSTVTLKFRPSLSVNEHFWMVCETVEDKVDIVDISLVLAQMFYYHI